MQRVRKAVVRFATVHGFNLRVENELSGVLEEPTVETDGRLCVGVPAELSAAFTTLTAAGSHGHPRRATATMPTESELLLVVECRIAGCGSMDILRGMLVVQGLFVVEFPKKGTGSSFAGCTIRLW